MRYVDAAKAAGMEYVSAAVAADMVKDYEAYIVVCNVWVESETDASLDEHIFAAVDDLKDSIGMMQVEDVETLVTYLRALRYCERTWG